MTVQILRKAGYSGWWSLLTLVPLVNIAMIWVFAFSDWPALKARPDAVRAIGGIAARRLLQKDIGAGSVLEAGVAASGAPIAGGATLAPECSASQCSQAGHQEPSRLGVAACQLSGSSYLSVARLVAIW